MTCITPVASSSSEQCDRGDAIELSLSSDTVTRNKVPLQRVATPSVLAVDPSEGYWRQADWVTLRGYGFLESKQLRCKFFGEGAGAQACVCVCACVTTTEQCCAHVIPSLSQVGLPGSRP